MSENVFRLDPENTMKRLNGWIGLPEAAERLGCSRQHAYAMAKEGKFKTATRIGNAHFVVVSTSEVEGMISSSKT